MGHGWRTVIADLGWRPQEARKAALRASFSEVLDALERDLDPEDRSLGLAITRR